MTHQLSPPRALQLAKDRLLLLLFLAHIHMHLTASKLGSFLPAIGRVLRSASLRPQAQLLGFAHSQVQFRPGSLMMPAAVPDGHTPSPGAAPYSRMADHKFEDSLVVVAHTTPASRLQWAEALRDVGLKVVVYPDDGPAGLDRAEFAVVWGRFPELWSQCPKLKAVQVMGAGVDMQLSDPDMPRHIPLLRVIDPLMAERMATWIMWGVINAQRKCDAYWRAQQRKHWAKEIENYRNIDNSELRVGLMGLGVMGCAASELLSEAGYRVSSWTRTPHNHEGVTCYNGPAELHEFVRGLDVLVCLLPLTAATRGIINAELLSWLPRGATIINAARGAHVVEADLLRALDEGQLDGAILDVFETEPLPECSPLWTHPKIRIFPHVSSMTNIVTSVGQMVHNRECVLSGRPTPPDLTVDWQQGY